MSWHLPWARPGWSEGTYWCRQVLDQLLQPLWQYSDGEKGRQVSPGVGQSWADCRKVDGSWRGRCTVIIPPPQLHLLHESLTLLQCDRWVRDCRSSVTDFVIKAECGVTLSWSVSQWSHDQNPSLCRLIACRRKIKANLMFKLGSFLEEPLELLVPDMIG